MGIRWILWICFQFFFVLGNAQEKIIGEINFIGTKQIKKDILKKIITTKVGSVLDSTKIEVDILQLQSLPQVKITTFEITFVDTNTVKINFNIKENLTLIPANRFFSSLNDDFALKFGLKEFNTLGHDTNLGGFSQFNIYNLHKTGAGAPYFFANKLDLATYDNDLNSLKPVFFMLRNAQEKIVTQINFTGTKRIKTSLLTKIIRTKKGSVLDSTKIQADILQLKRLPPVANATFEIELIDSKTAVITFNIEENFTLIPFANLFTSANDDFAFRIGLQEFNMLGQNITLGGFYQLNIYNSYGISARAPYLFTNKLGLAFNYYDLTTLEPVFFDEATADYKYNNRGLEILTLYEINLKNRVELGFNYFVEDYQYVSGFTSNNVPRMLNVNKYLGKFIYDFDNINYHYQYLNGFRSNLNLQVVKSTNNILPDFWIGFNDFLFYKRFGNKGNWANRLRLGFATNADSPFAPFTLDNNLNLRGVGNIIDRGTASIVLNTEYRHTLMDKDWFVLQSNIFLDGGSWRNPGGDLGDFAASENLRIYPGVGIRFMHKKIFNAIFRIDYGYGITKNASRGLVFGIGQYF